MTDVIARHPEITAAPIARPMFVVGLPRTGTSILHELLAQDPANRVPMTWEVMHPYPPPERATYTSDPRIAALDKHLSGVDRLLPEFKKMHPMGAELPQECVALTAHDFASKIGGLYTTILADPPWRFDNRTGKMAPEHQRLLRYPTMDMEEICEIPVSHAAAANSHLYLWVPNALLAAGLEVMRRWGFTYKSNIVWYKVRKDGGPAVRQLVTIH